RELSQGGERTRLGLPEKPGHELEGELDLVDLAEQEIARLEAANRRADGPELTGELHDARRALRPDEALAHESDDLAVGAAPGALVLVDVDLVEEAAEDLRLADDVLVAAVAGRRVHDLAAPVSHAPDGLREREQCRRVVAVVEDDRAVAVR